MSIDFDILNVMDPNGNTCPVCGQAYTLEEVNDILESPDGYVYDGACEDVSCACCGISLTLRATYDEHNEEMIFDIERDHSHDF